LKALFFGQDISRVEQVWEESRRQRVAELVPLYPRILRAEDLAAARAELSEVEIIFSTWGMPYLQAEQLACLPSLKAVFYAAGTVKPFAAPLLERGVIVCSAAGANAVPVAEFSFAQIILSLKRYLPHLRDSRAEVWQTLPMATAFGSRVGIIGLGNIAQRVCERLHTCDLEIWAHDPFATPAVWQQCATRESTLEEIFSECDVVSIHAPWLPQTEGMIHEGLLRRMRAGATLINTSRGALVREPDLIQVWQERPDLTALLDVTHPEPPVAGSPLYHLPNIHLTPHIAGSLGREVVRMADWMLEEFIRWQRGEPLCHQVTPAMLDQIA
jgi:phosphoglycerate dehydrogenase-like enzyme